MLDTFSRTTSYSAAELLRLRHSGEGRNSKESMNWSLAFADTANNSVVPGFSARNFISEPAIHPLIDAFDNALDFQYICPP